MGLGLYCLLKRGYWCDSSLFYFLYNAMFKDNIEYKFAGNIFSISKNYTIMQIRQEFGGEAYMKKISKIIWGVIYFIGTCITLFISIVLLSRSDIIINQEAMIPFQLYEQAFILLAFGSIPMVIACYMVYKVYEIKMSYHSKRNSIIIFIPGIICVSCATFMFGLLLVGMINSFILN